MCEVELHEVSNARHRFNTSVWYSSVMIDAFNAAFKQAVTKLACANVTRMGETCTEAPGSGKRKQVSHPQPVEKTCSKSQILTFLTRFSRLDG